MNHFIKLLFFSLTLTLIGCSPEVNVYHIVNSKPYPLPLYKSASPKVDKKSNVSLTVKVHSNADTVPDTKVFLDSKETKYYVIHTRYKHKVTLHLGRQSVKPVLIKGVKDALITESAQAGDFFVNDSTKSSQLNLQIEVLHKKVTCTVSEDKKQYPSTFHGGSGWIGGARYTNEIDIEHPQSQLRLKAVLMANDSVVLMTKEYYTENKALVEEPKWGLGLYYNVMIGMSDALAKGIAILVPEIVNDVNKAIATLQK